MSIDIMMYIFIFAFSSFGLIFLNSFNTNLLLQVTIVFKAFSNLW